MELKQSIELTLIGITNLSPRTLNQLSPEILASLSFESLKSMSATSFIRLSDSVINNLNPNYDIRGILDSIPEIKDNPYTSILSQISKGEITFDQKEYDSLKTYDKDRDIKNTGLNLASHIIELAGKAGYNLREYTSYKLAAGLIHKKKYPTVPVFNFDIPDNIFGMAYIETLAAFEASGKLWSEFVLENI